MLADAPQRRAVRPRIDPDALELDRPGAERMLELLRRKLGRSVPGAEPRARLVDRAPGTRLLASLTPPAN